MGGIFFDHLRASDEGMPLESLRRFAEDIGLSLPAAYGPLVAHRRDQPYGQRERGFQLFRRGRYVEFNLVHDRGTLFGLRTAARIESVLMSLPPSPPGTTIRAGRRAPADGDAGAARLGGGWRSRGRGRGVGASGVTRRRTGIDPTRSVTRARGPAQTRGRAAIC